MVLRAVLVTLLLGATLLLNSGSLRDLERPTPKFLMAVISFTYALTLVYAFAHRRTGAQPWFTKLQIVSDMIAWSAVVYATGGASSGFTFLYGIEITTAAILLGRRAAFGTACVGVGSYAALVGLLITGVIGPLADANPTAYDLEASDPAHPLLLNATAMLLVANLSGYLADRLQRSAGALRAAERRTADLAARHEDIVRSLDSGLITADDEWIVRTANPMALQIIGKPEQDVIGRPLEIVLPVVSQEIRLSGRGETTYRRADGVELIVGFTISRLLDASGTGAGHLVLVQDFSERHQLRHDVEVAERFAALGRLAAGLAHEIRNPLGSISGCVEMLRDAPTLSQEDRELAAIVLRETARLGDLVTDILLFARPRPPNPKPTAVGRLLGEVLEMYRRGAAHEWVQIRSAIQEDLTANLDPDQIRQVLWNLLKNAAEASGQGGEVTVSTEARDDGTFGIAVEDQGRGISPALRERIFDPFYSSRPEGLGIGLALVQQIVSAHGGRVEIDSVTGKGTTIRVLLPGACGSPAS